MFYTIYKITNKLNGKSYIGKHKTKDLNDGYMGSGKYLNRAIIKDGIENFTKQVLFVFDNREEMNAKSAMRSLGLSGGGSFYRFKNLFSSPQFRKFEE